MKTFADLGVAASLIKGLEELGIHTPTAVQLEAIPFLMENGGDMIAQAQTGTGKTAAFGLPLLTKVNPAVAEIQALVVAPTRELAKQIGKQLFRFTKYTEKIFIEVLTGGDNMDRQISNLRRPTHIVVATPGRLIDLLERKALNLASVRHLVLDEADEMLSLGFRKQLELIFQQTTSRQNTWLFSATIPAGVSRLSRDYMSADAFSLKIDQLHVVNRDITHQFMVCNRDEKLERITNFIQKRPDERGVIFCRTIAGTITFAEKLKEAGISSMLLHGDMHQLERDKVMRAFKKQRIQVLVATDVAARGIDVEGLTFVIHHQLPDQLDYYTHRSGRTARAGKKGLSLAFIEPRELRDVTNLANALGLNFKEVR